MSEISLMCFGVAILVVRAQGWQRAERAEHDRFPLARSLTTEYSARSLAKPSRAETPSCSLIWGGGCSFGSVEIIPRRSIFPLQRRNISLKPDRSKSKYILGRRGRNFRTLDKHLQIRNDLRIRAYY